MPAETRLPYTSKYVYDFLVQATATKPVVVEPIPGFEIQVRQWNDEDRSFQSADINAKFPALSFLVNNTWYFVHGVRRGSPNYRCAFRKPARQRYDFVAAWTASETLDMDLQDSIRSLVRELLMHVPIPGERAEFYHAC